MKKSVLGLMTCHNRKNKTIFSISRLILGNPEVNIEFLVVDDNSNDGTVEALQQFKNVHIIKGNGNLYYSGGMRLAIGEAKLNYNDYDYYLLFNDDVEFFDGIITPLMHEDSVWVGPTCDHENNLTYGGIKKESNILPYTSIIIGTENNKCDTFNANCVCMPNSIFMKMDNIDPIYTHSMGDFDLGFSLNKNCIPIFVLDEFIGICIDNPIENTWRNQNLKILDRIKLKESKKGLPAKEWFHYLKKNYNIITAIVYSIIPYLRIIFRK